MRNSSINLFKFCILKIAIILIGLDGLSGEDYFLTYPSSSLPATMINRSGRRESVIIKSIDTSNILYTSNGGEVSISAKSTHVQFEVPYTRDLAAITRLAQDGENETALEQLRPLAYPLVPYLIAPETLCNFHQAVYLLANLLEVNGQYEELARLMEKLPLNNLSNDFYVRFTELLLAGLENGYADEMKAVMSRFKFESKPHLIRDIFSLAMKFLDAGEMNIPTDMYQRIATMEIEEDQKKEAELMLTYTLQLSGETAAARRSMKKHSFQPTDKLYSLYKMISGRINLMTGNPEGAMMELSQGFVRLDYSSLWAEDMLFFMASTYDQLKNKVAIKSIKRELSLSFPDSKYLKKMDAILIKYTKGQSANNYETNETK